MRTAVELDEEAVKALAEFDEAEELEREGQQRRAKARDQLLTYLADHDAEVGTVDGERTISRSLIRRRTPDLERLRRDEPALMAAYIKVGEAFWQLYRKRLR